MPQREHGVGDIDRALKKLALVTLLLLAGGAAFVALRPSTRPSWSIARHEPDLLARGWASTPYASPLISQSNPSACGPTSLMNVWSSLDAGVFESPCRPAGFCFGGLTLDELAKAAERPGWKVTVLRDLTLEQFREELGHVGDSNRRYVINFHRGPIFGAGGGHHSPIGAVVEDRVFVLDVNKSYGPWLVPIEKLFEAMDTVDSSSGKKRGLLRIEL